MRLLVLLTILTTATLALAQPALDPTTLYVSAPLKWERGERPGQLPPKLAFAGILVIEPNGALAIMSCYLNRSSGNQLDILYQSGFSLSSGTWKKTGGNLAVHFRSIHASARRLDGTDGQYKEESWTYGPSNKENRLAEWIKVGSVRYVPLRNLSNRRALAETIQFYRKEAEAPK
jgi:hypothetical protein